MQKKTRLLSKLDIICGAASAVIGAVILLLLSLGVIYGNTGTGLDGGITKGFGILFYALFFIAESVISIYLIIEGIFILAMLKRNKSVKIFAIVNAIIRLLLAIPFSILMAVLFSLMFWIGAIFALLYTLLLVVLSVLGFISSKEKPLSE